MLPLHSQDTISIYAAGCYRETSHLSIFGEGKCAAQGSANSKHLFVNCNISSGTPLGLDKFSMLEALVLSEASRRRKIKAPNRRFGGFLAHQSEESEVNSELIDQRYPPGNEGGSARPTHEGRSPSTGVGAQTHGWWGSYAPKKLFRFMQSWEKEVYRQRA